MGSSQTAGRVFYYSMTNPWADRFFCRAVKSVLFIHLLLFILGLTPMSDGGEVGWFLEIVVFAFVSPFLFFINREVFQVVFGMFGGLWED